MTTQPAPIYCLKNLSLAYDNVPVLQNISLDIGAGERVFVIGPNGAGKSTLLKVLAGLTNHTADCATFQGTKIAACNRQEFARKVGYVPQAGAIFCDFTVGELVMMSRYPWASPFAPPTHTDKQAVQDALVMTGLEELEHRHLNSLSGGERQKALIAAALAQQPQVLLLDEPTTFLDPRFVRDIQHLLDKLHNKNNATLVTVTHDINHALATNARVIAIKNGRTVFDGSSDALVSSKMLGDVFDCSFVQTTHPQTGRPLVLPEAGA